MEHALEIDLSLEEEMSLNAEDRKWISREIQKATQSLNGVPKRIDDAVAEGAQRITEAIERIEPKGWRKAVHKLRELGPLATIIAIFVAVLGLMAAGWFQAFARVEKEAQFRTRTEDRLTGIETSLLTLRTKAVLANPPDLPSQSEAKSILASARKDSIKLPESMIEQLGRSFANAGVNDSGAWQVMLDFLNYRSILNASLQKQYPMISPNNIVSVWHTRSPSAKHPSGPGAHLLTSILGVAPKDEAAYSVEITDTLNVNQPLGPQLIVFDSDAKDSVILLDGFKLKHVIIKNMIVAYHGGPVQMSDVQFVNCTFQIDRGIKGQELASDLLDSPSIAFQASP